MRKYRKLKGRFPDRHYIHIALWVRKVVLNELDGWFHFKGPVRSLRIVPEEVLHQPDVELFWVKEFILVSRQYTPPYWSFLSFYPPKHRTI